MNARCPAAFCSNETSMALHVNSCWICAHSGAYWMNANDCWGWNQAETQSVTASKSASNHWTWRGRSEAIRTTPPPPHQKPPVSSCDAEGSSLPIPTTTLYLSLSFTPRAPAERRPDRRCSRGRTRPASKRPPRSPLLPRSLAGRILLLDRKYLAHRDGGKDEDEAKKEPQSHLLAGHDDRE